MIKVSIMCLVYNHREYLREALEGFVNQKTNFEYEVCIHDDASTDDSKMIIKEYEQRYPNIIKPIYQSENQFSKGVDILFDIMLPKINGKYIAFCEGDDYWTDVDKLQCQVDFLDSHQDYSACVHNSLREDTYAHKKTKMFDVKGDYDITFERMVKGSCYHTSSLMFRKEYAYNLPQFFYNANGVGDYPLSLHLAIEGKVRFINEVMSVYRFGTKYSWSKKMLNNLDAYAIHCKKIAGMLGEVNEYTNYQYAGTIEDTILQNEYDSLFYLGEYKELRRAPYDVIYKRQSLSYKVKTYIKQYFKKIYVVYRKRYK